MELDREGWEEGEGGKVISGIARCAGNWEVVGIAERKMRWSSLEMAEVMLAVAARMVE